MENSFHLENSSLEVPAKMNSSSKDSIRQRSKRVYKVDGKDYAVNFSKIKIEKTDRLTRSKTKLDSSFSKRDNFSIVNEPTKQQCRQQINQAISDEIIPIMGQFSEEDLEVFESNVGNDELDLEEKFSSRVHPGKRDILLTSGMKGFGNPTKRISFSEINVPEKYAAELNPTKDLDQTLDASIDQYLSSLNQGEVVFSPEIPRPDKENINDTNNLIDPEWRLTMASSGTLENETLIDVPFVGQLPAYLLSMNQFVELIKNGNKPINLQSKQHFTEEISKVAENLEKSITSGVPKIILKAEEVECFQNTKQLSYLELTNAENISSNFQSEEVLRTKENRSLKTEEVLCAQSNVSPVQNSEQTISNPWQSFYLSSPEEIKDLLKHSEDDTPLAQNQYSQNQKPVPKNTPFLDNKAADSGLEESLFQTNDPCCNQKRNQEFLREINLCVSENPSNPNKLHYSLSQDSSVISATQHTATQPPWISPAEDSFNSAKVFSVSGGSIERVFSPVLKYRPENSKYPGISIPSSENDLFLPNPFQSASVQSENFEEPKYVIELVDTPPPLRNFRSTRIPEIIPNPKLFESRMIRSMIHSKQKKFDKPKRGRRTRAEMELYREELARKKQNEKKTDMERYVPNNYFNQNSQRSNQFDDRFPYLNRNQLDQYSIGTQRTETPLNYEEHQNLYPSCSKLGQLNQHASGSASIINDQWNVSSSSLHPPSVFPIKNDFWNNQVANNLPTADLNRQQFEEGILKDGLSACETSQSLNSSQFHRIHQSQDVHNSLQSVQPSHYSDSRKYAQKPFEVNVDQRNYLRIPQQTHFFQEMYCATYARTPNYDVTNFKPQETAQTHHHQLPQYSEFEKYPQASQLPSPIQHHHLTQHIQSLHNLECPQAFSFQEPYFSRQRL